MLIFFVLAYETLTNMDRCSVNPWVFENSAENKFALTLEWVVGSPPGFHTFDEVPMIKDTVSAQISS